MFTLLLAIDALFKVNIIKGVNALLFTECISSEDLLALINVIDQFGTPGGI
jgi:hypothetical protein